MKTAAALLTAVTGFLVPLAAMRQNPSRDAAVATPPGSASISGTVVSDDADARPVRQAKVTVSGGSLRREVYSLTDGSGQFTFTQLPAGRYSVMASRAGYLRSEYGARRPGGPGVPVVIADQDHQQIVVKLPRGAVVTGTIRTADGEPASYLIVSLYKFDAGVTGDHVLGPQTFSNSANGSLTTDDRGVYRIYGLRPGEYYVAAQTRVSSLGGQTASAAEFEWAQRLIASPGMPAPPPPEAGQAVTFAPVFYPGTTDVSTAAAITVGAGEERAGVDFTLQAVPTATVSGVILDVDGRPPKISQISLLRPSAPLGFGGGSGFIRPDATGHFSTPGVVPGDYALAARGAAHDADTAGSTAASGEASMPLWALLELPINGRDVTGLELRLAPGANVSGRLVFDGATKPPADLTTVTVAATPLQIPGSVSMGSPAVRANADGTFVIRGVGPGRYRLGANAPGAGPANPWTMASAMVAGIDTLDASFDVVRDDVAGTVVTFTDHPTEFSGTLRDAGGRPAPQYAVLVASTDRSQWTPQSRRIRLSRPGINGSFKITGLPPGEYYVMALTEVEQNRIYSPAYLEPLVGSAIKVTLADGEKRTQDLKIATAQSAVLRTSRDPLPDPASRR